MEWHCRVSWSLSVQLSLLILLILLPFPLITRADTALPITLSAYLSARLNPSAVRLPRSPPPSTQSTLSAIENFVDDGNEDLITADVDFKCDNTDNALLQQFGDTLFLLSGNQLFRLNATSDPKRLVPLATFAQFTEVPVGFSVHPWAGENKLMVAVAFRTHYNVYQKDLPQDDEDDEKNDWKSFNRPEKVLQKLSINYLAGLRTIKLLLFTDNDELHLFRAETSEQNSSTSLT